MRNSSQVWCETTDNILAEIESRSVYQITHLRSPDVVFISPDLYSELFKSLFGKTCVSIHTIHSPIQSINTSAGKLDIKLVTKLRNFLLVGTQEDFDTMDQYGFDPVHISDKERIRIDQEFEEIILEARSSN